MKHHIPIKTDHWDVTEPGFTEIDLVSHSGDRADGEFVHSLDAHRHPHDLGGNAAPSWAKARSACRTAWSELRQQLPFALRGIDSDNGSGIHQRAPVPLLSEPATIQFTRGRPYKKDDNAHIEQKNWTHVRKLMGYLRYDSRYAVLVPEVSRLPL